MRQKVGTEMSRLKTLIFHPALAPYRIDLFNRLRHEMDLKVVFFSDHVIYQRELDQHSLRELLKCDYDYLLNGIRFFKRDFRIGMGRIIQEFKPDVVVSHEFSYATLSVMFHRKWLARRNFGHVLWTAENIPMLENRGFARRVLRKMCCQGADTLIVYTDEVREAFDRRWIPAERIFVCANHQEEESFLKKIDAARPLVKVCLRKHNLHGKRVVLFVGRLAEVKNLARLIEAFARASKQEARAVLVLVGTGPQKDNLEALTSRLGIANRVLFVGHHEGPELHMWYLVCAVLVLPSTWETYSAVVNEALLSGKPVLCSSNAGSRVLIREGKNGHVFDPYDINALVDLMARALANAPLAGPTDLPIRKNLMPVSFEDGIVSFVRAVEYAANISGRIRG